jgi:hypothetical protein
VIRDVVRYKAPPVWGVLCIDIWQVQDNDMFYQNALSHLSKYNIGGVVNCTTDIVIDYSDKSIYNTLKHYHWKANAVTSQTNDNVLLDLIKNAGEHQTSKTIHDKLFDQNTVHLSRKETFIHQGHYYWPEIQDWIILGSAWGKCVHYGPLGVDTLVDIPNHKFHIFPEWSLQTEDKQAPVTQQIHDDFFVWAPIDDNGYRLITRAKNHKWIDNQNQ